MQLLSQESIRYSCLFHGEENDIVLKIYCIYFSFRGLFRVGWPCGDYQLAIRLANPYLTLLQIGDLRSHLPITCVGFSSYGIGVPLSFPNVVFGRGY